MSETVNVINHSLSDAVQRTSYILEREGVSVDSESVLTDPEVVMEIMSAREAIEEAESEQEVEEIRAANRGM